MNVVTFHSKLIMRHEYSHCRVISEMNAYKEYYFDLMHCIFHKLMRRMTCILIDEMFYVMHALTIIITCTFLAELEVHERKFGSCMRIEVMKDS